MPKQPVLRPAYQSDAKYFRRLANAIERDESKPLWWRNAAIIRINDLIGQFEDADNVGQKEKETAKKETKTRL